MEVKLKVLSGKSAGRLVPVAGPKWFVGRSEECHLRPDSELVSRHHCVLLVDEGYVGIRDLGSKNGTLVNGARIRSEVELHAGDKLTVGPLEFEVLFEVGLGGPMKPRVHGVHEAVQRAAATPSAGEADLDISEWIGDEVSAEGAAQTTALDPSNTVKSHLDDTHSGTEPDEAPAEPEAPKPSHPLPPKPGEDTPTLAADVLRHFFARR